MPKLIDLTDQRFGKLTAKRRVDGRWECLCDCGAVRHISTGNLRRVGSCGCAKMGRSPTNKTHGMSGTSTYCSWASMIQRCTNPRNPSYPKWGGRGVTVCERWLAFDAFLADMGEKPADGYTIDRIDNAGPYSPENCRWATRRSQSNNRPTFNQLVEYEGVLMTVGELASAIGMDYYKLHQRLRRYGWTVERATSTP